MTYKAVITKLKNVRKHPNADRLQLADCVGNQIVIGLDHTENELGIFFPCDGQLSEEFAKVNDLIGYTDEKTGKKMGGFFAKNRRVRAQRFRGERSEGFWMPLSSLMFTHANLQDLADGDELDTLNNVPLCNKFITEATSEWSGKQNKMQSRRELPEFKMHFETEKFKHYADRILPDSLIILTEKLDATSQRIGYVRDDHAHWYSPILAFIGLGDWNYTHVIGTRKVILRGNVLDSYYNDNFRYDAVRDIFPKLHKEEVLYGEVCAWLENGKCVQNRAGVNFSYGVVMGKPKMFVYRIVLNGQELSWEDVKERCDELDIPYVPEMCEPFVYDGDVEKLKRIVEKYTDGKSLLDNHIREGVCVRVEGKEFAIYKNKSFEFLLLEDKSKEDETRVDLEEV